MKRLRPVALGQRSSPLGIRSAASMCFATTVKRALLPDEQQAVAIVPLDQDDAAVGPRPHPGRGPSSMDTSMTDDTFKLPPQLVSLAMEPNLVRRIDEWASSFSTKLTRAAAIRALVRNALDAGPSAGAENPRDSREL